MINPEIIKRSDFKKILVLPGVFGLIGIACIATMLIKHPVSPILTQILSYMPLTGLILIILSLDFIVYKLIMLIIKAYRTTLIANQVRNVSFIFTILSNITKIIMILLPTYLIVSISNLHEPYKSLTEKITSGILILLFSWFVIQLLSLVDKWLYASLGDKQKNFKNKKVIFTKFTIIKQILVVLVLIITIAAILMLFENVRNLGISLIASAGFLTAILGFAAQKPLSSIFTSLQLAFSQPIKINDVVIIENEYGVVEEITMSYAVLRLWDLRRMVVPINYFIENPFQNWSFKDTSLLGTVFLYVDFQLPLDPLREELEKQLRNSSFWNQEVGLLHLTDAKENCIELRILISADSPENLFNLRAEIREKMIRFIDKNYPNHFPQQRQSLIC